MKMITTLIAPKKDSGLKVWGLFERVRQNIKDKWGLDLFLSELVALKYYTKEVLKTCSTNENFLASFYLANEIQDRFMSDYFGLPHNDMDFESFVQAVGIDKIREHLKIVQESAYSF